MILKTQFRRWLASALLLMGVLTYCPPSFGAGTEPAPLERQSASIDAYAAKNAALAAANVVAAIERVTSLIQIQGSASVEEVITRELGTSLVEQNAEFAGYKGTYKFWITLGLRSDASARGSVVALVSFSDTAILPESIHVIYETGSEAEGGRFWKPVLDDVTTVRCGGASILNQWSFQLNTQLDTGKAKYEMSGLQPLTCDTIKETPFSFLLECGNQQFVLNRSASDANSWSVATANYIRNDCEIERSAKLFD